MMEKKSFLFIILLAVLLGCFFQFSRMDGFLLLDCRSNHKDMSTYYGEEVAWPQENYVIIYDDRDVASVLLEHHLGDILEKQHKAHQSINLQETVSLTPETCQGVLVATPALGRLPLLPEILSYAEAGGTVALLAAPEGSVPPELLAAAGVTSLSPTMETSKGLSVQTDFLAGAKDFHIDADEGNFENRGRQLSLSDEAQVDIRMGDGTPLVWQHPYGQGKLLSVNSMIRADGLNVGLYAEAVAHCGETGLYPVLGLKLFYIDDFPAPVSVQASPKLEQEYHLSVRDFYRQVWWPYMRQLAEDYDLHYTGTVIETYNKMTGPDFYQEADSQGRNDLIVYGRELLKMDGELAVHGYNHRPLVLAGDVPDEAMVDYQVWPSQQEEEASLSELKRYIADAYPGYKIKAYVPPGNMLGKSGYAAVHNVFPDLEAISSIYYGAPGTGAYYQDFSENPDGTMTLPRGSAGYGGDPDTIYDQINLINYVGVFSHFVQPDEILYPENADVSWQDMAAGLKGFLTQMQTRYPWLEPATVSDAADRLRDMLHMEYRVQRHDDYLEIACWNYRYAPKFIVHSKRAIRGADGAKAVQVGADSWLVTMQEPQAKLWLAD